ncbi:response regulator transcription factor [bacterium]|nr:MAG: response regulator transcription factor [bacterium]
MIRAIIVDDEPIAREIIRDYCEQSTSVELIQEFDSIIKAALWLKTNSCDVIFLDIHMPRVTGIDWLRSQPELNQTQVVLISAHSDFVSDSYELNVKDYLLKPVSFERFQKTVLRLSELNKPSVSSDVLLIRVEKAWIPIKTVDILIIQGMGDYIKIFTKDSNYLTQETMKAIYDKLPEHQFGKPHKSWIVNKSSIQRIEGNVIFHSKGEIPISLHFKDDFLRWFGI